MATGVVVRFDARRGYGFLTPDDGGEDVFVHQNNINMEGFRYLQVGERVAYELEVGEKGMKAVSVALVEPRQPRPRSEEPRREERDQGRFQRRDDRGDRGFDRGDRGGDQQAIEDLTVQLDKMRRKQERLISLLVEKGIIGPGDIDGMANGQG